MKFLSPLLLITLGINLISCSPTTAPSRGAIDYSPSATVTPTETLRIAESYRTHQWLPSTRNIKHGRDANDILVNTPDTTMSHHVAARPGWWKPDTVNTGIPYQWGGFDTPHSFDIKIKQGYFAGDVYTKHKRKKLWNGVSKQATGVDCSGFISRCWRLDSPHSTRDLPNVSEKLNSFSQLKPGDIVNKYNTHVLLFSHFTDKDKRHFMAYETGSAPSWKVLRHKISVNYVKNLGYTPRRYKHISSQ